jgi:DNA polymerase-3 subunit alpha
MFGDLGSAAPQPLLRPDTVVFITAEIDTRREEPCLRVNRITPLERVRPELAESVVVQLHSLGGPLEQMERMRTLCRSHRGRCPVLFRIQSAEGWTATVEGGDAARVNPTEEFMAGMSALAGADRVHCLGSSR